MGHDFSFIFWQSLPAFVLSTKKHFAKAMTSLYISFLNCYLEGTIPALHLIGKIRIEKQKSLTITGLIFYDVIM